MADPTQAAASHDALSVLTEKYGLLGAYVKMRGDLTGNPALYYYQGNLLIAAQGKPPVHVMPAAGVTIMRYARRTDGGWDSRMEEAGYYLDPTTGAVAQQILNPLNSQRIQPKHYRSSQAFTLTPSGEMLIAQTLPPGITLQTRVAAPQVQIQDVVVREDIFVAIAADTRRKAPGRFIGSLTLHRARLGDLLNPALSSADCSYHFQNSETPADWFELGANFTGYQMWQSWGSKLAGPAEIPSALRARIERDHPDLLSIVK